MLKVQTLKLARFDGTGIIRMRHHAWLFYPDAGEPTTGPHACAYTDSFFLAHGFLTRKQGLNKQCAHYKLIFV